VNNLNPKKNTCLGYRVLPNIEKGQTAAVDQRRGGKTGKKKGWDKNSEGQAEESM